MKASEQIIVSRMKKRNLKGLAKLLKEDNPDLSDLDYHYDMVLESLEDTLDFLKSKYPSASPEPYELTAALEMVEMELDNLKAYYAPTKVAIKAAFETLSS